MNKELILFKIQVPLKMTQSKSIVDQRVRNRSPEIPTTAPHSLIIVIEAGVTRSPR